MVSLILTGAIVKQWGHYVPYMIVGEVICIAGTAMLTQLTPTTSTVMWAAYLVVSGFGMGIAMQLPYTAVQVTLSEDDLPTGNAIAVLFYQLGGVVAISMGQTITISTLVDEVPKLLPQLPVGAVIAAGAANLPAVAPTPELLSILRTIWNTAIVRTMILSTALVGAAVPFTLGMEWLNAKKIAQEREARASDMVRLTDMRPDTKGKDEEEGRFYGSSNWASKESMWPRDVPGSPFCSNCQLHFCTNCHASMGVM